MKHQSKSAGIDLVPYAKYLIIAVPFLAFIATLRLGFVYFDDDILILSNFEKLINPANFYQAFRTDAFFANLSPYYRPLMNVSFMIDAMIGGRSPVIYHFSNLVYHILTCLALYRFLVLLGIRPVRSLWATLLFSIHPTLAHAIMWIPARGDILVTLFVLLSLNFLIQFLELRKTLSLILHLLFMALALFSKESGILLPVISLIIFWLKKEKIFSVKNIPVFLFWAMTVALWFFLRQITIDNRPDVQRGLAPVLKNYAFIPEAVARLLFPFNLPVTPVFTIPVTILGIILIGLLGFIIYTNKENLKRPLLGLGLVWFLGFCLPNMYVRLVSADDSFEYLLHRLYLPGVGFLIFFTALLPEKIKHVRESVLKIGLSSLMMIFIGYNLYQQETYRNGLSFWNASVSYAPERSWFHYHKGRYYFMMNDLDNYEKYLLIADSIKSYPIFRYNLAMIYYTDRKDYDKAYEYFRSALTKGFGDKETKDNFILFCIESSYDLFKRREYDKAIARCRIALENDPKNGVAAYNIGIYLITKGEKQNAQAMWRRAIINQPELKEAYKSLSLYYQYDVVNNDSATYFANLYQQYGGTEKLIESVK